MWWGTRNIGRWSLLGALLGVVLLGQPGCLDLDDELPEVRPTAPPTTAKVPATPLVKVDPMTLPVTLVDEQESPAQAADLKSALAGFRDGKLILRFETFGPPPEAKDIWFIVWLRAMGVKGLFKVQVSLGGNLVVGGRYHTDQKRDPDVAITARVRAEGDAVVASFALSELPQEFQVPDLEIDNPTIIQSVGPGTKSTLLDKIVGVDRVRR